MTDLCWQCQKNSAVIVRSSNCSEEEKSSTIKIAEEHLRIVQMERACYTSSCEDSSRGLFDPTMLRTIVLLLLSQHHEFLPTQSPSQVHYSFHYAQRVHFPSDPLQPDPIYFLSDPLQPDPIYFLITRNSECVMKLSPGKSTSSQMRVEKLAKEAML